MGNKRRRYNDEEKAGYISRLLHGESLQEISRKEGINYILLCRWRKEYQENGEFGHRLNNKVPATVTFAEAQAEIKRLRTQLEEKKLENMVLRDMLKKTKLQTSDLVLLILKWSNLGYQVKSLCRITGLSRTSFYRCITVDESCNKPILKLNSHGRPGYSEYYHG